MFRRLRLWMRNRRLDTMFEYLAPLYDPDYPPRPEGHPDEADQKEPRDVEDD